MKLKFKGIDERWIVGFGVYRPGEIREIKDNILSKSMLDTGYFDEVKEKEIKIKRKKSKKKGAEKSWDKVQEDT